MNVESFATEYGIPLHVGLPREVRDMGVAWNRRFKTRLGCFKAGRAFVRALIPPAIELNPRLVDVPEELRDTFLHEVAHAWDWVQGRRQGIVNTSHGRRWKSYATVLGARPTASCSQRTTEKLIAKGVIRPRGTEYRHVATCDRCGHELVKSTRSTRNYGLGTWRHRHCGGTFRPKT